MSILRAITFISATAITIAVLSSCAFPERTGYDRRIGDYKPLRQTSEKELKDSKQEQSEAEQVVSAAGTDTTVAQSGQAEQKANTVDKKAKAATAQKAKPAEPKSKGGIEQYARGWLGAKYVYGAASKKKTDCSGFVMQVYKGYYNIALDHSASKMFKDSRGSKIGRGSLKEGDLVFFGSFWSIDHVGIYLKGDRFIHASTSKGVIITPMDDNYWHGKYQGARRFK